MVAQLDMDTLMMEKRREDTADARQLNELFARLGVDVTSGISVADLAQCVQNRDLEAFPNAHLRCSTG